MPTACAHAASVAQGEPVLPARHKCARQQNCACPLSESKSCRQGAGITSELSAYISLNEVLSRARRPPTTTQGEKAVCVRNPDEILRLQYNFTSLERLNWRGSPLQELAPFDAAPSLPPLAQVLRSGTGCDILHHWRECRDHCRSWCTAPHNHRRRCERCGSWCCVFHHWRRCCDCRWLL